MKRIVVILFFLAPLSLFSQIYLLNDSICQGTNTMVKGQIPDSLKNGTWACIESPTSINSSGYFDSNISGAGLFNVVYKRTLNTILYTDTSTILVAVQESIFPITDIALGCGSGMIVTVRGSFNGITWEDSLTNETDRYITSAGIYTVKTTGVCPATEKFTVLFDPFVNGITKGPHENYYFFCENDVIDTTINTATPNTNYTYLWHDNNSTNPIRTFTKTGKYYLTTSDGNCSRLDSISFERKTLSLFSDELLYACDKETTLKTNQNFNSYLWNDGSTADTLLVDTTGKYSVIVEDNTGCIFNDSVHVFIAESAVLYGIEKRNDLCQGDSITLYANTKHGCTECLWSTGQIGDSITITKGGTYTLTANVTQTCEWEETINLLSIPKNGILEIITPCANEFLVLSTVQGDNNKYIWSTGDTASSINYTALDTAKIWIKSLSGNLLNCINDTLQINPVNCDSIFHIAGTVYWDENKNGVQDSLEKGMPNVKVMSSNPLKITYTDANGNYNFTVFSSLTTKITAEIRAQESFTTVGNKTISTIGKLPGNSLNNNFGVFHNANYVDLRNTVSTPILRPGFNTYFRVKIENNSFSTATNVVQTFRIDTLTTIDSIKVVGGSINYFATDSFSLSIDSLPAKAYKWLYVYVSTPAGVQNLGEKVCVSSKISSDQIELDTINNAVDFCTRIRGSYDPNHKEASVGDGPLSLNNHQLTYNIQFQNTGTDTAFNITIIDSLDLNFFKMETLKMLGSSHPYQLSVDSAGVAKWTFTDILLVDSITNEPLSHGTITFSIDYNLNIALQTQLNTDTLKNTAFIYFDYNPPIQTNVAFNYYSNNTSVLQIGSNEMELFPNPTTSSISVQLQSNEFNNYLVEVTDANGKTLIQSPQVIVIGKNEFKINVEQLAKGIYFIHIGNQFLGKFVKQ